ncbi:MAG: ROK family protein [Thermoleophilia bacterium]
MNTIGVDIGGSGIKSGMVDVVAGILLSDRLRTPTPEGGAPQDVAAEVGKQVQQLGGEGPVGVGLPCVVKGGIVQTAAHLSKDWIGLNAEQLLREATGRPVVIVNDADAAGIAEMRVGAGRDHHRGVVLMLTLGTGIGSALFVDGVMLPNLELGHIEVRGKEGELRAAASVRDRKKLSWADWAERVNEFLDHAERLLWPDLIILGGGVTKNPDKFVPLLKARATITVAELQNSAGIVGAAMAAADAASVTS